MSALATLIAAFAGAWFAFYLQDKKEYRKEQKRQALALNHALFGLIRQYQSLLIIKKEIEPFKDDPIGYINAPALSTNEYLDIKIHPEAIGYLLGSKEPALLMEIMLEHERFEMALKSMELRSKTHVNRLQPEMDRCQIKPGEIFSLEDFESKADFLTLQTIKNETQ